MNIKDVIANGEYWIWGNDKEDHLESLTCPVVIEAYQLRALLNQAEEKGKLGERERIADRLRKNYANVGRNASRTALYAVAKDISIELALTDIVK